ncbi:MAG: beta-aspartyl-peptidase [Desulfurococcaceae archaeon]|nr:beta-aspartyl-peptidase [Desulfurococcaceae archaeon]
MEVLALVGGEVYSPEYLGRKDILVVGEKIVSLSNGIPSELLDYLNARVIEVSGYIVVPGFIDQHVHIAGAGGEGGPLFRTPPVRLSQLVGYGITTVVGLLGTDGITRSPVDVLMRARQLREEGISAWMYTGSYQLPPPTITGSVARDIALIEEVIGVKTSVSDHRSSHPTVEELRKLISEVRVAGILSGKAGVVHVHVGNEKPGLRPLLEAIDGTDIPIEQLAPTHLNRNRDLLAQAVEFGKAGGYVDVTTSVSPELGMRSSVKASEAVKHLVKEGVPVDRITMSSDGNGSLPVFDERGNLVKLDIARPQTLYREFVDLVLLERVSLEDAVRVVSTNVADHLRLRNKGRVAPGRDADLVVLEKGSLRVVYVVARGRVFVEEGRLIRRGAFEEV